MMGVKKCERCRAKIVDKRYPYALCTKCLDTFMDLLFQFPDRSIDDVLKDFLGRKDISWSKGVY